MLQMALPHPSRRGALPPALPPVLACGLLAASLDLGFAIAWWTTQGSSATAVLQSIAAWTLGPTSYASGVASAVYGAAFYIALMCALAAIYRGLVRVVPAIARTPVRCGAAYGLSMYLLWFGLVLPALNQRDPFGPPAWAVACAVAWMFLIGVSCALYARRPARRDIGVR